MKREVEAYVEQYGENPPSPAQIFTVPHKPDDGNIYMVQKVFQGPFEVCVDNYEFISSLTNCSLIFYSRLALPLSP